jgi:hypothetical protein
MNPLAMVSKNARDFKVKGLNFKEMDEGGTDLNTKLEFLREY